MTKETQKQKEKRWIREGKARDRFEDKVKKTTSLSKKFHDAAYPDGATVGKNGLTRRQLEKFVKDGHAYRVEKFNGKLKRVLYMIRYNGG